MRLIIIKSSIFHNIIIFSTPNPTEPPVTNILKYLKQIPKRMGLELLACVIGSNVELNKHSTQIIGQSKEEGDTRIDRGELRNHWISFFLVHFVALWVLYCWISTKYRSQIVDEKQTISHYAFIYIHASHATGDVVENLRRRKKLINRLAWRAVHFVIYGVVVVRFCCEHKQIMVIFQSFQMILMAMCQVRDVKVSSPFLNKV